MTLLEMGGAEDQGFSAGGPEGPAAGGAVAVEFDVTAMGFGVAAGGFCVAAGGFGFVAEDFVGAAEGFGVPADGFDGVAEGFVWGVADRVAVRGEDDGGGAVDGVGDGTAEDVGTGDREDCTGMPIAGASACMPIRLLPMAIARIAPTTETGQPSPRSRRPRRPD